MEKLTTAEYKEVISLLAEYAQTKMLCIGQREKDLIRRFCAESSKRGANDDY